MAANIGPKIGIQGEKEYRQQLNQIIQQAKTLNSQMTDLTSSFTKNTSAEEKQIATGKLLAQQISNQRELVSRLADMTAKAASKYGENSTEALKWKEALYKAKTELSRLESQAETAADSTEELGEAFEDTAEETINFGDVLKANILGDAIMRGLDLLIDKVKDFASGMVNAAAEVKAQTSQFEQAFGPLGSTADVIIQNIANDTGILETRLRTTAAGIYSFAKASGADSTEALNLMETALLAAADNAAYYDRSLEDATDTLQSFLKGNYANDAALGVSATEATRNAAAFKKFKKEYKDLTEVQKQQTLLSMVTDAQELSGAMGQASREADGWENVQGNLNESFRQFQAAVGQPFLAQLAPRIQKITDEMQKLQNRIDWDKFGSAIESAFGFIDRNGEHIVKIIGSIGAGFASWQAVSAIGSVTTAVGGLISSLSTLGVAVAANPFGFIAGAAAALTAALALTYTELTKQSEATKALIDESEKFAEQAQTIKESIENRAKAADDAAQTELDEIQRIKDLCTELDTLVDANGKVDQKNRDRVNFIMNELKEATGEEIGWTDSLTTNYKELKSQIDDTLKSKQAEVLLLAAEKKYTAAIENRQKVEQGLKEATDNRTQAEKDLKEAMDDLNNVSPLDTTRYTEATNKVKDQTEVVKNAIAAEDDYKQAWADTTGAIELYETASLEMLRGNTNKVIELLTGEEEQYGKVADASKETADTEISETQRKYDEAKREYELYKEQLEKGATGFTDKKLAELKSKMDQAGIDLLNAGKTAGGNSVLGVQIGINNNLGSVKSSVYSGGWNVGAQVMNGLAKGISNNSSPVYTQIQNVVGNLITRASRTLMIKSPSRVFEEIGMYTMKGLAVGIEDEASNVNKVMTAAVSELPALVSPTMDLPDNRTQNITIPNINVYAQEGQDATEIAREVERIFLSDIRAREGAFA